VNEFVEECRREWKRLGVPDPVANEMAAELEADLQEAEGEGVSAEEVLGSGAFDPRAFATGWAAERGVVQRTPPNGHGLAPRARMAAAIGALALMAFIGGVLVVLGDEGGSGAEMDSQSNVAALSPDGRQAVVWVAAPPPGDRSAVNAPLIQLPATPLRIVAVEVDDSGLDTRTLGWVLLAVGLAGVVQLAMFSMWAGAGPWSAHRT
jgi:hypothetical protein